MKIKSLLILRIGLGLTFLVIGLMILKHPEAWGNYLKPWAVNLLPISLKTVMIGTGILDVFIGTFLLINVLTGLAALIGAFHLCIILITSGIGSVTIRDVGLLGASLAIFFENYRK